MSVPGFFQPFVLPKPKKESFLDWAASKLPWADNNKQADLEQPKLPGAGNKSEKWKDHVGFEGPVPDQVRQRKKQFQ